MEKLASYIRSTGQPQRAFAQAIGVTENQLSRIMRGIQKLTAEQAVLIEDATGGKVTVRELVQS